MKWIIEDRESGNRIDSFDSLADAVNALCQYEQQDRAEGNFTPDFYAIRVVHDE